jgi:hypothetical protein
MKKKEGKEKKKEKEKRKKEKEKERGRFRQALFQGLEGSVFRNVLRVNGSGSFINAFRSD